MYRTDFRIRIVLDSDSESVASLRLILTSMQMRVACYSCEISVLHFVSCNG